jgi:hypothetical protein
VADWSLVVRRARGRDRDDKKRIHEARDDVSTFSGRHRTVARAIHPLRSIKDLAEISRRLEHPPVPPCQPRRFGIWSLLPISRSTLGSARLARDLRSSDPNPMGLSIHYSVRGVPGGASDQSVPAWTPSATPRRERGFPRISL